MSPLNETVHAGHRGAMPLTRSQLRALVREWCLMLKEEGLAPETVLVAVKRLVQEAITPSVAAYADAEASDYRREVLVSDASQWCIEAYFDATPHVHRTYAYGTNGDGEEPGS